MKKETFSISEFIERHRLIVGSILLLLVLAGTGVLIYRERYQKVGANNKIQGLETRVDDVESEIAVLQNDKAEAAQIAIQPPTPGETKPVPTTQATPQVAGVSTETVPAAKVQPVSGTININTATAEGLDTLPGIGPTYAKRIIEYREAHGGFKSINEVTQVKGIGPKTLEKFKDKIVVN